MAPTNETPAVPSALVDIKGAGKLLGLSYWQVRNLIRARELPVLQIGIKFYLRRATVLRWAERSEAPVRA